MIPKLTSHELNDIFNESNEKLESMLTNIRDTKNELKDKLKIIRYESEYLEGELMKVMNNTLPSSNAITICDKHLSYNLNQFGCTVTPTFKTVPVNAFNIISTNGQEAFFRDIVDVAINGISKKEYCDILKHDSLSDKKIFLRELEGEDNSIEVEITIDPLKALGATTFNMIEFDPYFNGAYTIDHIRIYKESAEGEYDEYKNYTNAGKMRIMLDKQYDFYKVVMKVTSNYSTQVDGIKVTPIGLKHIYFYNAKYEADSTAIMVIEAPEYIDTVNNSILIKTPNGTKATTIEKEGIKLFLNCTMDSSTNRTILSSVQEPSNNEQIKTISINTKKVYAQVPVRSSIIGIGFKTSSKIRE